MNFVGLVVLFFYFAVYGTLAFVLMARVITGLVNDLRIGYRKAEPYV